MVVVEKWSCGCRGPGVAVTKVACGSGGESGDDACGCGCPGAAKEEEACGMRRGISGGRGPGAAVRKKACGSGGRGDDASGSD